MNINYFQPFADFLALSYGAEASPHHDVISHVSILHEVNYSDLGGGTELYSVPDYGTIKIISKDTYVNISMSGGILRLCRETKTFTALMQTLAMYPHNITRVDIAYDVPVDGADSISSIQSKYPSGDIKMAKRTRKINYVLDNRFDGRLTGTAYFQNRNYKGTIFLRMYDKAHQSQNVLGYELSPTTRYELTVKRGACLRDVTNPDSMFWHFMPSDVLRKPPSLSVELWFASELVSFDKSLSLSTDYEKLRYVIENSPSLLSIAKQASQTPGGVGLLQRTLERLCTKMHVVHDSEPASGDLSKH